MHYTITRKLLTQIQFCGADGQTVRWVSKAWDDMEGASFWCMNLMFARVFCVISGGHYFFHFVAILLCGRIGIFCLCIFFCDLHFMPCLHVILNKLKKSQYEAILIFRHNYFLHRFQIDLCIMRRSFRYNH